ncbi:MAG: WD40 repeat domain-containing protein [Cyanobacteria bacterium J06635_15]
MTKFFVTVTDAAPIQMMKLLPYNHFSIQTIQTLPAVIAALDAHIEPPKFRWGLSRDHAPYTGTLSNTGFKIRRIIHYRNSFLPNIRGRFEPSPGGTVVHITLSLHPVVIVFLVCWLSFWYGISLPIFLSGLFSGGVIPEIGLFLLAPLILFSIFWGVFWFEANRSQRELIQIIQGNPLVPPTPKRFGWQKLWRIGLAIIVAAQLIWFVNHHQRVNAPEGLSQAQQIKRCDQQSSPSPYCSFSLTHTLTEHPTVTAIALSPDNTTLVSGGRDKAIKVWDLQTGELQQTRQSDSGVVTGLAIAPDGQTIVSGGGDRMVRIWDLTTDQPPQMLQGHTSQNVGLVEVSADGNTIVSGGYREIKLWDRTTGELKATLPEEKAPIEIGPVTLESGPPPLRIFDISADGSTVLVELNNKLTAWNLFTQQQTVLPHQWFTHVNAAYLSPDGQTVVTTSYTQPKNHLKIWDLATGDLKANILLSENRESWGYRDHIAVNRDSVIASTATGLKIWNLQTGELEAILETELMRDLWASPAGQHIIGITGDADSQDAQIQIWQRPSS